MREAERAPDGGAVLASVDTYIDSLISVPFYERRMGYERRSIRFQKRLEP